MKPVIIHEDLSKYLQAELFLWLASHIYIVFPASPEKLAIEKVDLAKFCSILCEEITSEVLEFNLKSKPIFYSTICTAVS